MRKKIIKVYDLPEHEKRLYEVIKHKEIEQGMCASWIFQISAGVLIFLWLVVWMVVPGIPIVWLVPFVSLWGMGHAMRSQIRMYRIIQYQATALDRVMREYRQLDHPPPANVD